MNDLEILNKTIHHKDSNENGFSSGINFVLLQKFQSHREARHDVNMHLSRRLERKKN